MMAVLGNIVAIIAVAGPPTLIVWVLGFSKPK